MSNNLVEQLREMVEKSREESWYLSPGGKRELFTAIADRIEREYMPLPRFEDGEPVKVGDLVLWNDRGSKRVEDIKVKVFLEGSCGTCNSVLKRSELDTLERIEKDAMKVFSNYWGCGEAECRCCPSMVDGKKPYERYATEGCGAAQRIDLLQRQRKVLERGQE